MAVVAVLGAACGGGDDSATERLIEEQTGENVEIDSEGGGMSIQTEDGSMSIDEDGNIVITDDQGETITGNAGGEDGDFNIQSEDGEFSLDSGGEIPPEWPGDVPEPSGIAELTAATQSSADDLTISLTGQADKGFVDDYASTLEDAGFVESSAFEDDTNVTRVLDNGSWTVAITLTGEQVGVTLLPAG